MNKSEEIKIDVFQSRYFRRILEITWQDRVTSVGVWAPSDLPGGGGGGGCDFLAGKKNTQCPNAQVLKSGYKRTQLMHETQVFTSNLAKSIDPYVLYR